MRSVCEPIKDRKSNGYIFRCGKLIVFPPANYVIDARHNYIVEFEEKMSKTGRKFGVAISAEIFHVFVTIQQRNETRLDVKNLGTQYNVTISNIGIKTERCKVCGIEKEKEIPITKSANIVVSEINGEVTYFPYDDSDFVASYDVVKYLTENNIKLQPNVKYKTINIKNEKIILPSDIDPSEIKTEEINELPADANAYSYNTRKFVHLNEETKEQEEGIAKIYNNTKYYLIGNDRHIVEVDTIREYEYDENLPPVRELIDRKVFENYVKVNAFINIHREKAVIFKALYKTLTKAGYRVTIIRKNGNKKVRVEKNGQYGEASRYGEFPTGYYALLAKQIYELTF